MKKMILLSIFTTAHLFSVDTSTFSGDKKLACEAILCLSSAVRPGECSQSLNRYFSIYKRNWAKTITARINFLQLCPAGEVANSDKTFLNLRDKVIAEMREPCDVEHLNRVSDDNFIKIQIDPTLTQSCENFLENSYTYYKPKYICDPKKFYSYQDWNHGFTTKEISKEEYENDTTGMAFETSEGWVSKKYFLKTLIEKNCWIFEN